MDRVSVISWLAQVCVVEGLVTPGRRGCLGGGLRNGGRVLGWMLVLGCERDGFVHRAAPWTSLPYAQRSRLAGGCPLACVGGARIGWLLCL